MSEHTEREGGWQKPHRQWSPTRTRTRTNVLFWIAAITGMAMYSIYQYLLLTGFIESPLPRGDSVGTVSMGVDIALGFLALAMLPAAIRHDPMEVQESYVGPPSALVAGLVVLCLWMVSILAAPAGAVVLISLSARLSRHWTLPAIGASILSICVHELTYDPLHSGFDWPMAGGALLLTLLLVGMGTVRGVILRRQAAAAQAQAAVTRPAARLKER